jgi:hypothetical protein
VTGFQAGDATRGDLDFSEIGLSGRRGHEDMVLPEDCAAGWPRKSVRRVMVNEHTR